jgi:GH15 family glucan-1,4-alpha-glucosidase
MNDTFVYTLMSKDRQKEISMHYLFQTLVLLGIMGISACSSVYYSGLEKIGIPKREVMVHRVEKARDTQEETKEQFKSALDQFIAVTRFRGGDLEATYNKLNSEYEASVKKADEVKYRIREIEDVSEALFIEWENEITQYSSASLKRSSQSKLNETKQQYRQLITAMKSADAKIAPILAVFKDQVMFLKHNLNAQAIASLETELGSIRTDVSNLVAAMEKSINEANAFIKTMEN